MKIKAALIAVSAAALLAAVVEDTLGITLKKEHSAADWSTRPLPDSWLDYAALDVLHLVDVRDALVAELEEQGKTAFAAQEFAAVLAKPAHASAHRVLATGGRSGGFSGGSGVPTKLRMLQIERARIGREPGLFDADCG